MTNKPLAEPQFTYPIFDMYGANLFHGTYSDVQNNPDIVYAVQKHGDKIEIVDSIPKTPPRCDALITQKEGIFLAIKHADCQAAILYDPVTHTIAIVHAGWKGLVKNIYKKTVHTLQQIYSILPENLLVAIGPSLGPKNSQFVNYKTEFPDTFWSFQESPLYFNLREIAKEQLITEGVLKHKIYVEETDTFEDAINCHSYRRDKTNVRMTTIAGLTRQTAFLAGRSQGCRSCHNGNK
jgi:YfiH family protein